MSTNGEQTGSRLIDSVDQMVRWPIQMTEATWDLMMQGVQSMTGQRSSNTRSSGTYDRGADNDRTSATSTSSSTSNSSGQSGPSWSSLLTGQADQDLSGDDLKYVIWSIVFTKPGHECVIEPQHEEIVNYSADGSSFAAVKIARFLEKARNGHVDKPEAWGERYPVESSKASERRSESTAVITSTNSTASASSGSKHERGWRVPAEDHKYIHFLYRVDRRLPKEDVEVTRVERVTVERGPASKVI